MGEAPGQICAAKQGHKIEARALHKDAVTLGDVLDEEVPAIRRKDDAVRFRMDRPCRGLELAIKEVIEAAETRHWIRKASGIQAIAGNEGRNFLRTHRAVHAPAIPARESRPLYQGVQCHPAQRVFIDPAQKAFAVHRLGVELAGMAVEEDNGIRGRHGRTPSRGGASVCQPPPGKNATGWRSG